MNNFSFEIVLQEQDIIHLNMFSLRVNKSLKRIMYLFPILGIILFLITALLEFSYVFLIIGIVMFLVPLLLIFMLQSSAKKLFRENKHLQEAQKFNFENENIIVESSMGFTRIPWEDILNVYLEKEYLEIEVIKFQYFIIPFDQIDRDSIEKILNFFEIKVPKNKLNNMNNNSIIKRIKQE